MHRARLVIGGLLAFFILASCSTGREQAPTVTVIPLADATVAILTFSRQVDGMTMVYIPAGEFKMGSDDGSIDEQPVHAVYLDGFWIDETEVTNSMFGKFVTATGYETDAQRAGSSMTWNGATGRDMPGADWQHPYGPGTDLIGAEDHPAVHISWNDASTYCEWAGARLPSEAEWEKAAGGGLEGADYPWGDEAPTCDMDSDNGAHYYDCNVEGTIPVGSFEPNGYGLYDMAGNVWEWVEDWYGVDYYSQSPGENPHGPASGDYRSLRGGSWGTSVSNLRVTNRNWLFPDLTIIYFGFRCADSEFPR